MSVPTRFSCTHYYRIAGHYIFSGDLYLARRSIYFFPLVDLAEQRRQTTEHLPHHFALIVLAVTYLAQNLNTGGSRNEIWEAGASDELFRQRADAHIEALKQRRKGSAFSEMLPVPTRVGADEISDLKLSRTGKLSFFAQSDKHEFNIGLRRRKRVHDALWESGLVRT